MNHGSGSFWLPAAPAGGICEWEASRGSRPSDCRCSTRTDKELIQCYHNLKTGPLETMCFQHCQQSIVGHDTQQCVDDPVSLLLLHIVTCQ